MKNATLVFLVDGDKICLGMKKRGFGVSRWNGFGGKVNIDEEIEDAAVREVFEETSNKDTNSGVIINKKNLNKVALLTFTFPHKLEDNQTVHVFFVKIGKGDLNESDEMRPEWFDINDIPYSQMWSDDIHWLPRVLKGEKINGEFTFNEDDELTDSKLDKLPLS